MKPNRYAKGIICAAITAAFSSGYAAAADPSAAVAAQYAQYIRLHQSAVAFVDSIANTSERYGPYQSINLEQVRALIAEAEQNAQRNDYLQASQQARVAYEVLRSSIMESVAKKQTATGGIAN